MRIGILTAS